MDCKVPAIMMDPNPGAACERCTVDDAALLTVGVAIRDAVGLPRRLHMVGVAEGLRFLGQVQNTHAGCPDRLKSQEKSRQQPPEPEGHSHAEKRQGGRRLDNRPPLLRRSPRSSRSPQSMF